MVPPRYRDLIAGVMLACTAAQRGVIWPSAELKGAELKKAARCGEVYQCQRGHWKFEWRQMAVPFWQLAGKPRPAECAVTLEGYNGGHERTVHDSGADLPLTPDDRNGQVPKF